MSIWEPSPVLQVLGWTLFCIKIIVAKSEEMRSGRNLAESSKEGFGSKREVLSMNMMMTLELRLQNK
jgi:hypothetical protein